MKPTLTEQVFEVRYHPSGKMMDYRGEIAEMLREHLGLPHWRITKDRVDVHDKPPNTRAFVSFRNFGYVRQDVMSPEAFVSEAGDFTKYVGGIRAIGNRWEVQRVGARFRFLFSSDANFDTVKDRLAANYAPLTETASTVLDASIRDLNPVLYLEDPHGKLDIQTGPMEEKQIADFFSDRRDYPPAGLYFDIDYWRRPAAERTMKDVVAFLNRAAELSWDKAERIADLTFGA